MLAAIDIHKAVFQAAVLDPGTGALVEQRFAASREALAAWAREWNGRLDVVAIEATTGWRWVAHELQALGIDVRLTDPGQASALQGRRQNRRTTGSTRAGWCCCSGARCSRTRGRRPRTSSACATRRGCARRSPTITRAGRNACTPCSCTRAGHARVGRC